MRRPGGTGATTNLRCERFEELLCTIIGLNLASFIDIKWMGPRWRETSVVDEMGRKRPIMAKKNLNELCRTRYK